MKKMITFFVLMIIAVVFGSPLTHPQFKSEGPNFIGIIGGQDANITDYPYQIAVDYNNNQDCGGSILSTTVILTAAHCFRDLNPSNVTIRVGSSIRNSGGKIFNVKKINWHPNWNVQTLQNDIAVVQLNNPLTFGSGVQPVKLPNASTTIVDGENATVTGWGLTSFGGSPSHQLQVVTLPLVTTSTCQLAYRRIFSITSGMVCAGGQEKDVCTCDSGGPLVVNGTQLGIVSAGTCGNKYPGIYTKVSEYLDFINQFLNK